MLYGDIERYAILSGRRVREDGTIVNVADGINEDGTQNIVLKGVTPVNGRLPVEVSGDGIGKESGVEILKNSRSTVADFQFWGEVVDGNAYNPGFPVRSKKGRRMIIKNNTDVALRQVRAYCFLRDDAGTELYRSQLDFANIPAGETFVVDASNFPDIDGAWTHISLRTNATGRTTGDVQVIYVSRGYL